MDGHVSGVQLDGLDYCFRELLGGCDATLRQRLGLRVRVLGDRQHSAAGKGMGIESRRHIGKALLWRHA